MQRFRKILMVYNEAAAHQPALAHVIALAGQTGARLTFVDVLEDLHLESGAPHAVLPDDLLALRREDIAMNLKGIGADLARVDMKVLVGNAPVAIIQEVLRGGHDLVVKTARGPDMGLGGRLFGSTAIKLMRKAARRAKPENPLDFAALDGATAQLNLVFGLLCTGALGLDAAIGCIL